MILHFLDTGAAAQHFGYHLVFGRVLQFQTQRPLHVGGGEHASLVFAVRILLEEGVLVEVLTAHICDFGDDVAGFLVDHVLQIDDLLVGRRLARRAGRRLAGTVRAQPYDHFDLVVPFALRGSDLCLHQAGYADEQEGDECDQHDGDDH